MSTGIWHAAATATVSISLHAAPGKVFLATDVLFINPYHLFRPPLRRIYNLRKQKPRKKQLVQGKVITSLNACQKYKNQHRYSQKIDYRV
jgi:hypothetical protein